MTNQNTSTDWEKLYNQAVASRHAFRQMAIRYRNALRRAVEWAGPMGEAPVDSRPEWFDIARAALEGPSDEAIDPRRDEKFHQVSLATIEAQLFGCGFVMILLDNSFKHIPVARVQIKPENSAVEPSEKPNPPET